MSRVKATSITPYDLVAVRHRAGLTQERLAEWLGISLAKIGRIEKAGQASKEFQWAVYGVVCHLATMKGVDDR